MEKNCLDCGMPVYGRTDKKFCSDACRNNHNNGKNRDATNYIRNVNNILRKNRRILQELNPKGKNKQKKEKLVAAGFHFGYFTDCYTTKQGNTYRYCYDQGYLILENEWIILVWRQAYVG